jgi:two-component system nitrogen regulation response regulator GlnG
VGGSAATLALLEELVALAEYELPVLVTGETGTGKELVARALHDLSPRRGEPFEAVNCAAIPRELIASALFGHERGAFTGAISTARGAFERAGAGTIFLDEIGDMPLDAQASLLRVLQDRRFSRVGGERVLTANARIVSATNRDLAEAAAGGTFRADLFYRIQMYSIGLVPLRERKEDIPELVLAILEKSAGTGPRGREARPYASPAFLSALAARELPGNVRELEGLVLGAVVRARRSAALTPAHLLDARRAEAEPVRPSRPPAVGGAREEAPEAGPAGASTAPLPEPPVGEGPGNSGRAAPTYSDMERDYIQNVLAMTGGNKREAASLMGIPRTTLNARMKKLGI